MTARRSPANSAWEALLSAHAGLIKEFAAAGSWDGISMREYDVMYTLSKCGGPVRLSDLNRHVLLSQPALSRMVDRLVERGLVERKADPADARGLHLSLTPAGRAAQLDLGRRHGRTVAEVLSAALSPAELRQLEALCLRLASRPATDRKGPPSPAITHPIKD